MSAGTPLSRWLEVELPKRGYKLDGPRSGGITRLAQDTGISQATMSRVVNGQQEPTIDTLRKIGELFGYTLGEMMVYAGLADSADMTSAAQLYPKEAWERLGELLRARRLQLGSGLESREAFAKAKGLTEHLVVEIEESRRANFSVDTLAAIETAYQWAAGSVRLVLDGADPRPVRQVSATAHLSVGATADAAEQAYPIPDDLPDYVVLESLSVVEQEILIRCTSMPIQVRLDVSSIARTIMDALEKDRQGGHSQPRHGRRNHDAG